MREKPPPPPTEDIPAWFMTYSDVITLLMTFFILLLTFSTSEPEMFEQMQVSVFGGGGARGSVGPAPNGADNDAWIVRMRPKASRHALSGTETPPTLTSPTKQAINKGIEALQTDQFDPSTTHSIQLPLSQLLSQQGELSRSGQNHVNRLARMLQRHEVTLTVQVSNTANVPAVLSMAEYMIRKRGVVPTHIGISLVDQQKLPSHEMRLVVSQSKGR